MSKGRTSSRSRQSVLHQRQGARSRRRGFRTISIIILFFAGMAMIALLCAPGWGAEGHPAADARSFFYRVTGLLGFLIPALLLLGSFRLLKPSALPGAFLVLNGLAVNLYFLAALTDIVGRRINPSLAGRPGGMMAGRAVDLLTAWMGPLLAYLVLLLGFVLSLIVFTGWDIAGDLASIPINRLRLRGRRGDTPAIPPVPVPVSPGEDHSWAKNRTMNAPPALPSFIAETEAAPVGDRKRQAPPVEISAKVEDTSSKPHSVRVSTEEPGPPLPEDPPGAEEPSSPQAECPPGELPPETVLMAPPATSRVGVTEAELRERADVLVRKLFEFGVVCEVVDFKPGPVLTRFELRPGPGVKVNSIVGRSDDLALALKASRIRILAPIPGRDAVGIEVPNPVPDTVFLREILRSVSSEVLPVALGRRMEGEACVADIADMPHLLVAGATGTGKSICLHSILCTILMKKRPGDVRIALIDPKKGAELSTYGDLPHLWSPVVCDSREARLLLENLVREMENRYGLLAKHGVRSIGEFNRELVPSVVEKKMPHVILVIDELADLMATSASEIEQPIARLAQMARAVGIHLVVATQRPSVDVITGIIKANFPSRIAFMVGSKTDSRTILDMNGAEMLLGRGDMLYLPSCSPEPLRIQGSLVSGREIRQVVNHWRQQDLPSDYAFDPSILEQGNIQTPGDLDSDDDLLRKSREIVIRYQIGSQSLLQRKLKVGFSRAGRIMDQLEEIGVVGPIRSGKARDVLISRAEAGLVPPIDTPSEEGN